MKLHIIFCIFISLLMWMPFWASDLDADEVRQGDEVAIVTPGTEARLCPRPGCGPDEHITRIPQGTILKVERITDFKIATFSVQWFAVTYDGNKGWISIYDTNRAPR